MSFLKALLPEPTDGHVLQEQEESDEASGAISVIPTSRAPQSGISNVIALPVNENQEPDYSAVTRQGENATRTVHASYDAMVEKCSEDVLRPLPTKEESEETAKRTREKLQQVVNGKLTAGAAQKTKQKPTFVRYTPANANVAQGDAPQQRIIKMVSAPVDPMLPPKFAQRKAPVNPPSPPVPVLHSPERKLTKEEAAEWKIPPVVSDWKNNRGYTISLDKRLASDGRGTVDHSINDRFAHMAESLFQADRTAREDVQRRAGMQREVSIRAKAARERELRELAEKARQERKGYLGLSERTDTESVVGAPSEAESGARPLNLKGSGVGTHSEAQSLERAVGPSRRRRSRFGNHIESTESVAPSEATEGEDDEGVRRRDEIRRERGIQREREIRQREARGEDTLRPTLKRSKITRDFDRDVSERMALGQQAGGTGHVGSGEVLYDERLFNHGVSEAFNGPGAGHGGEEAYNLYDAPLFKSAHPAARFRYSGQSPTASRRHARAEGAHDPKETPSTAGGLAREGRVEFEKDSELKSSGNSDPYGLQNFFANVKRS